jgi:alpha-amylase/alpha-mannosidase (GH57 family)
VLICLSKRCLQEWLKKYNEERDARIAKAKADNAAQEQAATKGPVGNTEWEKVNSMIDFTFKPPQEKEGERERFKSLLFAAKDKNVPCKV